MKRVRIPLGAEKFIESAIHTMRCPRCGRGLEDHDVDGELAYCRPPSQRHTEDK